MCPKASGIFRSSIDFSTSLGVFNASDISSSSIASFVVGA